MLQEMLQEVDSYHKFPHQNFSEALLGQSSFGRHKDKSWRKARVPCTWLQWNWLMRLDSVSYSQNRCREKTNAMQEFKGILTIWPVAWFVNSAQRVWVVCNPRWHFFQVIEGPFKLKLPACMYVWWVYIYILYVVQGYFRPWTKAALHTRSLEFKYRHTHTHYIIVYIYMQYIHTHITYEILLFKPTNWTCERVPSKQLLWVVNTFWLLSLCRWQRLFRQSTFPKVLVVPPTSSSRSRVLFSFCFVVAKPLQATWKVNFFSFC